MKGYGRFLGKDHFDPLHFWGSLGQLRCGSRVLGGGSLNDNRRVWLEEQQKYQLAVTLSKEVIVTTLFPF